MANSNGQTPLYIATRKEKLNYVQALIAAGANVNTQWKNGMNDC